MKRKQTVDDVIVLEELFLDQTLSKFHSVFSILKLRSKKEHQITDYLNELEALTLTNLAYLKNVKKRG